MSIMKCLYCKENDLIEYPGSKGQSLWCTACKIVSNTEYMKQAHGLKDIKDTESKWIKCSERLPDKDGCYLVFVKFLDINTITIFYFTENGEFHGIGNITHWMPLPSPPEIK